MADYTKDSYYQLSLNILKALGGDISIPFADADAIWDEIYKIYDHAGGRFDIVPLQETITKNGTYDYYPESGADAYMPVNITVSVPQDYTDEDVAEIRQQATIEGYNTGYVEGELAGHEEGFRDGFTEGETVGANTQKAKLAEIQITENGIYTREDGYKTVTVEVDSGISEEEVEAIRTESFNEGYAAGESDGYNDGYAEGLDDGVEDQKALLTTIKITENGVYEKEDGYKTVTVEVAGSGGGDTGKPKIYNGFRLLTTDATLSSTERLTTKLKEVDFTQYDWSGVYDLTEFFGRFKKDSAYNAYAFKDSDFDNFRAGFNGRIVCCDYLFMVASDSTTNYTIAEVPDFSMFTDDLVSMRYAFYGTELKLVDNITKWNTSNVVTMEGLFAFASSLTSIPVFDTSNVMDMNGMFKNCSKLASIPALDYSNAVIIDSLFASCTSLTSIPDLDISSAIKFAGGSSSSWLYNTPNITSIGALQCDNIEDVNYMFGGSQKTNVTYFGGAINLGKRWTMSNTSGNYAFYLLPNLSYESVINILNGLYDRAAAGMSVITLKLHANHLAMLSDDDIAIATNKGWTLS